MHPTTIFSPADILLPTGDLQKWAVVACDQFTSEPTYWTECEAFIGDAPSSYRYILPEAYLGTEKERSHGATVAASMKTFDETAMRPFHGIVYLERTLPNGAVRRGMVGKIDLEAYDYGASSQSPVRATEATVLERIPPRCKIRSEAAVELPHILILIDDRMGILDSLARDKDTLPLLYDFPLMMGGGRAAGYGVSGERLSALTEQIAAYEKSASGVVYAMGDGNHSLAAAKAHYENLKQALGEQAKEHPARYALAEVTALFDPSLVFEPIYRVVQNCDVADVWATFFASTEPAQEHTEGAITVLAGAWEKTRRFPVPTHALTVGTLQNFLDGYLAAHPSAKCDYIHGEDVVRLLAKENNTVGFLFDGLEKEALFPYVERYGALPRKTFSMGEAAGKRYYLEMRRITER